MFRHYVGKLPCLENAMKERVLAVEEAEKTECEWHGHRLMNHQWHDTVDGYQRCANCKHLRDKPKEEK